MASGVYSSFDTAGKRAGIALPLVERARPRTNTTTAIATNAARPRPMIVNPRFRMRTEWTNACRQKRKLQTERLFPAGRQAQGSRLGAGHSAEMAFDALCLNHALASAAASVHLRPMESALATIVHLDADAFFVSVELAKRPELRGQRVAVGGRERGIISSASYEARAAGVYTPMPTQRAKRVCPDLILLPHSGDYGGVSRKMFDLCETLTPFVQRNSIDEGYLDLTACGFRSAAEVETAVRGLQVKLWEELQIPVSIGIGCNRLVAQIASKLRKPRGFVIVPPGTEASFLAPLELGRLPGVGTEDTGPPPGPRTRPRVRRLQTQRIRTRSHLRRRLARVCGALPRRGRTPGRGRAR